MRSQSFALLACALFLAAGAAAPAGDAKDDMKRIQGTWVVDPATYAEVKDEKVLKEVLKDVKTMRFIFEGDTFTLKHPPSNAEKGGFRLDPTKKPKQIDMSDAAQGIYQLKGDTLKLCWDQHARTNGRPTKFAHDKKKGSVHYFILKREKK